MIDKKFIEELEAFKNQIDQETITYVKAVVGAMLDMITDGNPLDTGRATASWEASTGAPVYRQSPDITPTSRVSRSAAKERSMATLLSGLANYKLGDPIFLSNGEKYISKLELNNPEPPGYVKTKDGYPHFVSLTKAAFVPYVDSRINISAELL